MTQKNNLEAPQLQEGRKVETEEWDNDVFLRQEWIPCGKNNCIETPDLHGPYWYSYRNLDGRWKQTYHGNERPVFGPPRTFEEVQSLIDSLTSMEALSNEQLSELRNAVADIRYDETERATQSLGTQTAQLIARENGRRKEVLYKRYLELINKDGPLSKEEGEEMQEVVGQLEQDH